MKHNKDALRGKNIMITGGAGFIGSHVVEMIVEKITDINLVVVVDNFNTGTPLNLKHVPRDSFKLINLDITDREKLAFSLEKYRIDIVVHMAATPLVFSIKEPVISFNGMFAMAQNLLECQRSGCFDRLISFSTSEVYGGCFDGIPLTEKSLLSPATPYASAKIACDVLIQAYTKSFGSNATVIRPFNNYGPRKVTFKQGGIIPTTISRFSENKPIQLFGGGSNTRDFVHVSDTARFVLAVLLEEEKTRGEIIQLSSGVIRSMKSVVEDIARLMNVTPKIEIKDERQGDVKSLVGDSSKAEKLLGFKVSKDWDEGLKECIEYYK